MKKGRSPTGKYLAHHTFSVQIEGIENRRRYPESLGAHRIGRLGLASLMKCFEFVFLFIHFSYELKFANTFYTTALVMIEVNRDGDS